MQINTEAIQILYDAAATVSPHYIHELIGDYINDAFRLMDEMVTAYAQQDFDTLHRAVHTLKSQSAGYGAMEFSQRCQKFESAVRAGNLNGAEEQIQAIRGEYAEVKEALQAVLERMG
jgi:HPt (histidine-containing phosphotransfer) domain-containing protein